MKKMFLALSLAGVFAAASFAVEARAVKARVPFDFEVGAKQLPAGVYTVEPQGLPGVLMLRDAAGHVQVMFQTSQLASNAGSVEASLVFNKYGDRYFLTRVWNASGQGGQLNRTRIERELMASAPSEQVLVAAIYR